MTTQCERLLNALLQGQKINPLASWRVIGIYRLASRIHDLRSGKFDGTCYPIQSRPKQVQNRFNDTATVAEYYIKTEDITDIAIARAKEKQKCQTP